MARPRTQVRSATRGAPLNRNRTQKKEKPHYNENMNFGYGPERADPEKENAFWEYVRGEDFESLPTTMLEELDKRGWIPPDPDELSMAEVPAALERLVLDLSWLHVYLHATDHLPDREM